MSNLTPAGYSRLDQETAKLAENDRERELSAYRPGDKNLFMFNTSGITRITQDRQTRLGQSNKSTTKQQSNKPNENSQQPSNQSAPAKTTLLTSSGGRRRIYGMGKTTGNEKPASVQKPKLGGN
tara:strand:+ start:120 stop:491 length:372 start_codon:yes stop_codon:yes gene_type:complete